MIIPMSRLRVMGSRHRLDAVLPVLQDTGLMHLAEPRAAPELERFEPSESDARRARHLRGIVRDVEAVAPPGTVEARRKDGAPGTRDFARWARAAGRARRQLAQVDDQTKNLEAERAEIARFEEFVDAFHDLLPNASGRVQSYHLVLRGGDDRALDELRRAVSAVLGDHFTLEAADLASGDRAVLLLVHSGAAEKMERVLAQSGIRELPLPAAVAADSMGASKPALRARREALDHELGLLAKRRREVVDRVTPDLEEARAVAHDRLIELEARERVATTRRSFVLEGWVPTGARDRLIQVLAARFGDEIAVEEVAAEEWRGEEAPVVLTNPRLFQPFEALTRMLPLPHYGSIDPTPYLAVFFPMFFGLMMGDIGYGFALAALAFALHRGSRPGTARRAVAEIMGPCAAFSIAFGIAFGELFGDLGRRWFGLRPLVLDREKALLPFLGLALAIGLVHVSLGMVLGLINRARGRPREAIGRGAALAMVLLVVVALLAGLDVLPRRFFTPAVIGLLAAFPVLVIAEGIIAPIELLSTFSNILSYARVMALGTASVMMAIVANRMAGSFGSVVVGVVFGLLFHLVNFALGIFAPAIHGLRLHYVEFFGKFYSPGGQQYRPLRHWRPDPADQSLSVERSS
jgi:V/A-type H+-transporting ATPase subunit I